MLKERTVKVEVEKKENYTTCDRCGKEIKPYLGKKYDHTITFRGVGIGPYYDYSQSEVTYDCCQDCAVEIKKMFQTLKP